MYGIALNFDFKAILKRSEAVKYVRPCNYPRAHTRRVSDAFLMSR